MPSERDVSRVVLDPVKAHRRRIVLHLRHPWQAKDALVPVTACGSRINRGAREQLTAVSDAVTFANDGRRCKSCAKWLRDRQR